MEVCGPLESAERGYIRRVWSFSHVDEESCGELCYKGSGEGVRERSFMVPVSL